MVKYQCSIYREDKVYLFQAMSMQENKKPAIEIAKFDQNYLPTKHIAEQASDFFRVTHPEGYPAADYEQEINDHSAEHILEHLQEKGAAMYLAFNVNGKIVGLLDTQVLLKNENTDPRWRGHIDLNNHNLNVLKWLSIDQKNPDGFRIFKALLQSYENDHLKLRGDLREDLVRTLDAYIGNPKAKKIYSVFEKLGYEPRGQLPGDPVDGYNWMIHKDDLDHEKNRAKK